MSKKGPIYDNLLEAGRCWGLTHLFRRHFYSIQHTQRQTGLPSGQTRHFCEQPSCFEPGSPDLRILTICFCGSVGHLSRSSLLSVGNNFAYPTACSLVIQTPCNGFSGEPTAGSVQKTPSIIDGAINRNDMVITSLTNNCLKL